MGWQSAFQVVGTGEVRTEGVGVYMHGYTTPFRFYSRLSFSAHVLLVEGPGWKCAG